MKRIYILVIIFPLILFLFACGDKNTDSLQTEKTDDDTDKGTSSLISETVSTSSSADSKKKKSSVDNRDPDMSAIKISKTSFSPDEEMTVSFTASLEIADNAWIGIIPSDVPHGSNQENDDNDIDFDFLAGRLSGTTLFLAPHFKGNYDARISDPDTGIEVASVSFSVK